MATLPDASSLGARPNPQPSRGIAGYDGGASARALGGLAQVVGKIGEDINREEDAQAVFEARRKLDAWERDNVFDPEKGAITLKGRDAFDLPKTLPESFDKASGEIGSSLQSNRQRQAFAQMAESRRGQVASWADGHALKQRDAFNLGQYEADVKAFQDRAVLFAQDEPKVRTELALMNERTVGFLRGKGLSEEVIGQAVKENATKMHLAVIASKINDGDASGAQKYLTEHAAGMDAESIQRVRNSLHEGLAREKSQAFGDEMDASGKSLAEQQEEARKRFKGAEETAALQEIGARASQRKVAETEAMKANESEVWKIVGNGGGRKQIPVGRWNALDGKEQTQVNEFIRARQKRAEAEAKGKAETDMDVFYGLVRQSVDKPEEFAGVDLMRYSPWLKDTDMKQLIAAQAGMNKGDLKAMGEQRVVKKGFDLIKAELASAGIDTSPNPNTSAGKKQAEELAKFNLALRESLLGAQDSKGGKLTDEEIRRIALGQIREGVVQGSGIFWDDKKRGYQLTPDERSKFVVPYDKIPEAIRKEIEADLYPTKPTRGLSIDKGRIERAYSRALQAGAVK